MVVVGATGVVTAAGVSGVVEAGPHASMTEAQHLQHKDGIERDQRVRGCKFWQAVSQAC
jgi:hypothetical protein